MNDLSKEAVIARIRATEARVRAAGLRMTKICAVAGVSYSSWMRWRGGASSPRIDNLHAVESKAREMINERRADLDAAIEATANV